jgi:hypothetical protein
MKLYKKQDFIKLPAMTIYSKVPTHFELCEGLFCKTSSGEEYTNDFVEQDLISEGGFPNGINCGMEALGYQMNLRDELKDFRTDLECACRDGMYEDEDTFVVWDREDVIKLRDYLNVALSEYEALPYK